MVEQQSWKAWQSPSLPEKIIKIANVLYWIDLDLAWANDWFWNGDSCMVGSRHSEVSSTLPGLSDWVPGEDRGEVVPEGTAGDEEDIVNRGSS